MIFRFRRSRNLSVDNKDYVCFGIAETHLLKMGNTYTQLYIHVVFAVKGRESLIQKTAS